MPGDDAGGDPVCWAHLFEGAQVTGAEADAVALDAVNLAGADGAVWSLPHDGDLDANLVKLSPAVEMAGHRNTEVDVILVALAGGGVLTIDGQPIELVPHHLVRIRKGTHRRLDAGPEGLVYLTVHPARSGLRIGTAQSPP